MRISLSFSVVMAAVVVGCSGAAPQTDESDATDRGTETEVANAATGVTDPPKALIDSSLLVDRNKPAKGLTRTTETTGLIQVQDSYLVGAFFEDDTVIRDSEAPNCLMYLRSGSKPASKGGTMNVSGSFFGQPGGPPAPITLNASPEYHVYETYLDYPPVFYPHDTRHDVSVKASGFPGVPPLPLTTVRSPAFSNVAVTAPAIPADFSTIFVDSKKPFQVKWVPPSAKVAGDAKMIFALWNISIVFDGFTQVGEVRCEAPITAGKMTVPASLLTEAKRAAEPNNPVPGIIMRIYAGDRKEVRVTDIKDGSEAASYSVELSSEVGTSFGEYYDVTLK